DKEFYNKVCDYAQYKSEYFGQENAKLRLLNSILDAKEGTPAKGVIEYAESFGSEPKQDIIQYTTESLQQFSNFHQCNICICFKLLLFIHNN
ncbi:MAG: hypothetical protein MUO21_01240, partial [Nitrososphaeraceae archaeon]|nr:hypothetical protein [Nitrososphaeraceae archaeon]